MLGLGCLITSCLFMQERKEAILFGSRIKPEKTPEMKVKVGETVILAKYSLIKIYIR